MEAPEAWRVGFLFPRNLGIRGKPRAKMVHGSFLMNTGIAFCGASCVVALVGGVVSTYTFVSFSCRLGGVEQLLQELFQQEIDQ